MLAHQQGERERAVALIERSIVLEPDRADWYSNLGIVQRDRLQLDDAVAAFQQAVAIGRALMSNPRLLLLDEVSLGLAPVVVSQVYDALPKITLSGTTVLLVEQNVDQAVRAADRVQCLLEGRTVLEGAAGSFDRDQIARAYFGV